MAILLHIGACGTEKTKQEKETPTIRQFNSELKLVPCPDIPKGAAMEEVYLQSFNYTSGRMMFGVNKVRLGGKTPLIDSFPFPNTRKGTHLHLNIANKRHHLSNTNVFEYDLPDGAYRLFAFVNRSYRIAIQNEESIISRSIEVKNGELTKSRKNEQGALIYNMPYGIYKKEEAKKVILDYVLYNMTIGGDGNYIKVIIDNENEFVIKENKPYYLENLTEGKHICRLELYNSQNQLLQPAVEAIFEIR